MQTSKSDASTAAAAKMIAFLLPLLVIGAAIGITMIMVATKKPVTPSAEETPVRVVEVYIVDRAPHTFEVVTHGTVEPASETDLVAEVTGRILETASVFVTGGAVEANQVLLRIDPAIYHSNVAAAEAQLARAEAALQQETAEAELARKEWQHYGEGDPSPLVLRQPQLAEAKANCDSARVALDRAKLDLERTTVVAPYTGRIRSRFVEVGQFVSPGTPLARCYSTEFAEVRLPISPVDLAHVELPLGGQISSPESAPAVELTTELAGQHCSWQGWIIRTEAQIDLQTRMLHAVARIAQPYVESERGQPPLMVGLFVKGVIRGRTHEDLACIPRSAIHDAKVWCVDSETRLRQRSVEVVRLGHDLAWINGGLNNGDAVCVTTLDLAVEGMKVRVSNAPTQIDSASTDKPEPVSVDSLQEG